mmetsp:Transcript_12759/g.6333  ORF Transcript_12759/g.6333 Transcript_12759/m.6333 type:complete len:158 (-) Transcript_12759:301-774(-)
MSNTSPLVRATIIASVKYACSRSTPEEIVTLLQPLTASLHDPELPVKRASLISLNSVVHHSPQLLKAFLNDLLPAIFEECKVRPELISEIDLGPFKHKQDDGLPLRKAAHTLLETLVDNLAERIDCTAVTDIVVRGLQDPSEEVQAQCYQILIKLCG